MAASKKATSGINRDAEKLVAKLARAGGTASGYEAVVDAGAVLALGGAFTEALACLHRVWECPEKVHRLLVQGKNPREDSFATWLYKKTGAWAAPLAVARAASAPSSNAMRCSNIVTVGLPKRAY